MSLKRFNGMSSQRPLVSCILPTRNRPQFIGQAISYFLRQDYPARELIIIDDGDVPVADLVPDNPSIRYFRLDGRLSLGEKRNLACELSLGEFIAHWDDDDWIAPERLSIQVDQIRSTRANLCGSAHLLHYDLITGETWQYTYPTRTRPWVAGCTLLYKRTAWAANPFQKRDNGEDTSFVWRLPPGDIQVIDDIDLCVSIQHGRNTYSRKKDGSRWQQRSIFEIRHKLGPDFDFYTALQPPPVDDRRPSKKTVSPKYLPIHKTTKSIPNPPVSKGASISPDNSRVTVSIPYYQCKCYIGQAVESILAQTYTNFRLVVVNDGDPDEPWDMLAHIKDPRLIRFKLEVNRGRYFADAVVLNATPDRYFLVQDADDYSEPERLARLFSRMQQERADGVVSGLFQSNFQNGQAGGRRPVRYSAVRRRLGQELSHRLNHFGLFKVALLKQIGGFYGGFRISYDTLLMNLLLMTGCIEYVDEPLYTRVIRPDSLTTSQATGLNSAERSRVRRYHKDIYRRAYEAYNRFRADELPAGELIRYIRQQSQQYVTTADSLVLQQESARLREAIACQSLDA